MCLGTELAVVPFHGISRAEGQVTEVMIGKTVGREVFTEGVLEICVQKRW